MKVFWNVFQLLKNIKCFWTSIALKIHLLCLKSVSLIKVLELENVMDFSSTRFLSWAPTVCHFFPLSIHLSVRCTPYLRNCISSDHNFWYTCVKWWYLWGFFYFTKSWFSGLLEGEGVKGQKMIKNSVCCTPYLRNHTSYDFYLCYTCVKQ